MGTETIYCTITALLLASVVATKAITVRLLVSGQDNIKDLQFELMQRREALRKSQKENKVALQKERSLKYKRKALMKKVDMEDHKDVQLK